MKSDSQITTRIPIIYSPNTPKTKTEINTWPTQNLSVSQSAKTVVNMISKTIPQFVKPPLFTRAPMYQYRKNKKPSPNLVQGTPIANRMPFKNKIIAQPSMPIIVSTRSLFAGNRQPIKPPFISSELTVTKFRGLKTPVKSIDITPQVTIRKKSQIVNNKDFFNMAKPITIIDLDDDDEDSCNNGPTPMEVVEIEFESVSDNADVELDSTMNNDTVDGINSPLSTHSSSEKENSEPPMIQLKNMPEEPVCKKPKLSNSTDIIVEINKEEGESSVPTENSSNERLKEVTKDGVVAKGEMAANVADADKAEIHITFQKFLDLCLGLDDSDDMKRIVTKRLKHYYKLVDQIYIRSKEFCSLIETKMTEMKASPDYMFIYIKDVVVELKARCKKTIPEKIGKLAEKEGNYTYFTLVKNMYIKHIKLCT